MATFTGADKAIGFLFDIVRNIADDYDSTSTYAQGAYTIYDGTLYKCIAAVSSPEDFNPGKWDAVLIMDEVAAGGGGGGTTVIANPAGSATDTLNKLQVENTIYSVPSGGGGSGHSYSTTEQVIGVWLDGSTLYERTIIATKNDLQDRTFTSSRVAGNIYLDQNYPVVMIDEGASGAVANTTNGMNWQPLNYSAGSSSYTRTNIQRAQHINSGKQYIYFDTTYATNVFYSEPWTLYLTIKYTKSV